MCTGSDYLESSFIHRFSLRIFIQNRRRKKGVLPCLSACLIKAVLNSSDGVLKAKPIDERKAGRYEYVLYAPSSSNQTAAIQSHHDSSGIAADSGLYHFHFCFFTKTTIIAVCGTLVLIINLLRLFYSKFLNGVFEKMYRWRWLIAAIVFVVLLCFQIHTSNAACYMYSFTANPEVEQSILMGRPRIPRADEYAVQLPYYFSQYYNDYAQISHQMSIGGQDMIVGYNSPVLSLS